MLEGALQISAGVDGGLSRVMRVVRRPGSEDPIGVSGNGK